DGDKTPDAPRYRALGNAVAVPVAEWIGRHIMLVEAQRSGAASGACPCGADFMRAVMTLAVAAMPPRHPAQYTALLLPVFARILREHGAQSVLDPMAGVGKIGLLRDYGFAGRIVANEIEPEWAVQAPPWVEIHVGDAANMTWARDGEFDAIVTSPTYGNRMADHHNARDGSRRYTYRHRLGLPLHPQNRGQWQWGEAYREAHRRIWKECSRALRPGGIMVVNGKNRMRRGGIVRVSEWHADGLRRQGLEEVESVGVA